jgi:hypothetical protein
MNQKILGFILIVSGILLFLVIYSHTSTILSLSAELHKNCPLPENVCPYKRTIPFESYFGFSLSGMVFLVGLYLTVFQEKLKAGYFKKIKVKRMVRGLKNDEKKIFELILKSDGMIFQSDLVKKTGFSKVKVSRILDKLETKGMIERRRRGMANLIVLKNMK